MSSGLLIAGWLLGNVLLVGIWDIYALFFLTPEQTVSHWIQTWFRQLPVLAVAVGIILGHLAWPNGPGQGKGEGYLP